MKSAIDEGRALEPLKASEVAFPGEEMTDEAALALVLQDTTVAEKFINGKNLPVAWDAADNLFSASVTADAWPGTNKPRSALPMPVVMEAIESVLPQAQMAFFSDPQPFLIDPKGQTTKEQARAMGHVANWALKEAKFQEETRKIIKSCFQYGNGVGKYGWARGYQSNKVYSQGAGGAVDTQLKSTEISCPTFEFVDLRNLLVDSATRSHDITTARFVEYQKFIDASELDSLRDDYDNVPTREQLALILAEQAERTKDSMQASKVPSQRAQQAELSTAQSSADPLKQNLELLEYWTKDRVITVLQRCIVLRNEPNEFGELPFRSCAFIDVLNAFYGFGISRLLAGEQGFQVGVANLWVDSLSLRLNPMFHRKGGIGQQSQSILAAPGRVVNDSGDLEPLQIQSITEEAQAALSSSDARAAKRIGANFGPEMPTQAMRTAEGVQAFTAGVQVRLQYFVENFATLVFIPVIEAVIQLCKDNLTPEQVKTILSDADSTAFVGDIMTIYNGKYNIQVLSSTKLAARRAMAQLLPLLFQMVQADPVQQSLQVQNKKIDYAQFIQTAVDLTGFPADDLIVDMTPEDQQRAVAQNQALVKAQAGQQQQAQKHQDDLELEQAKGDARAGVAVVKHVLDGSKPEEPAKPLATQQPK